MGDMNTSPCTRKLHSEADAQRFARNIGVSRSAEEDIDTAWCFYVVIGKRVRAGPRDISDPPIQVPYYGVVIVVTVFYFEYGTVVQIVGLPRSSSKHPRRNHRHNRPRPSRSRR